MGKMEEQATKLKTLIKRELLRLSAVPFYYKKLQEVKEYGIIRMGEY